jgi:fructose-bisphosphate aldolase/2-amino-3,7-dideoxy-D-threo-hept-6-ulosonate synthase
MTRTRNPVSGTNIRMRRIFRPTTGRSLIVPLDHAVYMGVPAALADAQRIIADASRAGADAVLMRPGLLKAFHAAEVRDLGMILMLSGRVDPATDHVLLNSVEHAVRCGADAVAAEFKLGTPGQLENIRLVSAVAEAARSFGLPVLVITYALSAQLEKQGPAAHVHACRIAEEMGADIIKTALPNDADIVRSVLAAVSVPVLLSGGDRGSLNELVEQVETGIELGLAGAAIGRNVWEADDPVSAGRRLSDAIHRGKGGALGSLRTSDA